MQYRGLSWQWPFFGAEQTLAPLSTHQEKPDSFTHHTSLHILPHTGIYCAGSCPAPRPGFFPRWEKVQKCGMPGARALSSFIGLSLHAPCRGTWDRCLCGLAKVRMLDRLHSSRSETFPLHWLFLEALRFFSSQKQNQKTKFRVWCYRTKGIIRPLLSQAFIQSQRSPSDTCWVQQISSGTGASHGGAGPKPSGNPRGAFAQSVCSADLPWAWSKAWRLGSWLNSFPTQHNSPNEWRNSPKQVSGNLEHKKLR